MVDFTLASGRVITASIEPHGSGQILAKYDDEGLTESELDDLNDQLSKVFILDHSILDNGRETLGE